MSKEYYRKKIVGLRADLEKEKEHKKKDNETYADYIKRAGSPDSKASYRKMKIDRAASHDKRIESLKKSIADAQASLKREKS